MALEGQLKDFNLAEILQLIASQQKSGFLVLQGQREMVFIFDKGVLVSTRDRRSEAPDPLETYLRNYGFFSETQWNHVAFIAQNSSLDLTEIVVSERLLTEDELTTVLKNMAVELAHRGMKMRRGNYHFTATQGAPPGVRGRIELDVQSLLMEAARRLDEEPQVQQALPSLALTFRLGAQVPADEALSPAGHRVYKLALSGRPVGRIIRRARADAFTTRELLKTFVQEGWLQVEQPGDAPEVGAAGRAAGRREPFQRALKHPTLTIAVALLLLGFGASRWLPLTWNGAATVGLAATVQTASGAGGSTPATVLDETQLACRELRLRQIQSEVSTAAALFHYEHGAFPPDLGKLVEGGQLDQVTGRAVEQLGWRYVAEANGQGYRMAM
jgi:hypothetical protein